MTDTFEEHAVKMAALSRQFHLGDLYDYDTDRIIEGIFRIIIEINKFWHYILCDFSKLNNYFYKFKSKSKEINVGNRSTLCLLLELKTVSNSNCFTQNPSLTSGTK